jgi:cyclin T
MKLEYLIRAWYEFQHKKPINTSSQTYKDTRENILKMERLLLPTLQFDLKIELPYRYLLSYLKKMPNSNDLAQTAWNFVNDNFRTTICLQFPPEKVAAAAFFLAARYKKVTLPANWLELLGTDQATVDKIGNLILDLYQGSEHANRLKQTEASTSVGKQESSTGQNNTDSSMQQAQEQNNSSK